MTAACSPLLVPYLRKQHTLLRGEGLKIALRYTSPR